MIEVQVNKMTLRDARLQLRLSQVQLGDMAEVSQWTIVRAEQGETIRGLTAQALLDALNSERVKRGWSSLERSDLNWNVQGE